MLAAVRWRAVALGVGAGLVAGTLVGLALWPLLVAFGVDQAQVAALTAGVVVGLATAGYAAGRLTSILHRFHGSLAGLGVAALVVVTVRLGGSSAPTRQVLLLALLAIVLGGLGGIFGGRSSSTET